MITDEDLAQQFTAIIEQFHPRVWKLLRHCYVKVIHTKFVRLCISDMQYIGIYCPNSIITALEPEKDLLREVAKHIGLVEVMCLNATNLVRDPMSKLKQSDPRLWLELNWIATQEQ